MELPKLHEAFLLANHSVLVPQLTNRFSGCCDRCQKSYSKGQKCRKIFLEYFKMCRNVEICILRVDILEIGRYSEQPLKNKLVYVGKKISSTMLYGFLHRMASASARRSRLAKASLRGWVLLENENGNIADSYMNAFNKPCSFLSHPSKPWQHMPSILIV